MTKVKDMKATKYTKETLTQIGIADRGFPDFQIGDAIAVSQRIKEGDKERIQIFEGDVIAIHNNGIASTFTVRKIGANSVSVERIFPFGTPLIQSIELLRKGDVRRAKLYFMRDRVGKSSRVREKVITRGQREQQEQARAEHTVE